MRVPIGIAALALAGATLGAGAAPASASTGYRRSDPDVAVRYVGGHPVNRLGFVIDGSAQLDDAHCAFGSPVAVFLCEAQRYPELIPWVKAHSRTF